MKQSNKKYKSEQTAFIYVRLSRDDGLEGDSYSIINQKKLLTKIAKEKGYSNIKVFCDDGISGVTMNRPDFKRMIEEIELGRAAAVFVKDLSRLGRNYIEVGRLTEEFFPEHHIRFISVSDNIDTEEGESELAPIKNLFNEWYSRDISKKRKLSNKIKAASGIPLGPPPYGYIKDPDNPNRWIINYETAPVVRRIFDMAMSGFGTHQIADILSEEKILIPSEYADRIGVRKIKSRNGKPEDPYCWSRVTVNNMLDLQEYCGDIINFKTFSISYKNKRRYPNDPENMIVFKDVHEPIIDRNTFETLQLKRHSKIRRRKNSKGEVNMFSGLLVCSDCKRRLHYHFNQKNSDIEYFNCPGYNMGKRKDCTATHHVRVDFLEQVVLAEIRRLTRFASHYEDEFTRVVSDYSKHAIEMEVTARKNEVKTLLARDKELDSIFEHLYEDNLTGKISDERFKRMSDNYEKEQQELHEQMKKANDLLETFLCKEDTSDRFISSIKKYTHIKKLNARILHELIERIEVHHIEVIDGKKTQRIEIFYNCVGSIDIPQDLSIPDADVSVLARQGVEVKYLSHNSIVENMPACIQ